MAVGSLIHIASVGAENVGLTIDASATFWRQIYEKHTMFAIEPKEVAFRPGTVGYGAKNEVTITRSADMVTDLWLVFELSSLNSGAGDARFTNDIGRALIREVKLEIGNVVYDTKDGEYLHGLEKLTVSDELGTRQLTGDTSVEADLELWATGTQKIYVPLSFWFVNDRGQALPLVALYQHDVKLTFTFRPRIDVIRAISAPVLPYDPTTETGGLISNLALLCEYVYLTTPERNYFANGQQRYLITETQKSTVLRASAGATEVRLNLTFNHPCIELIWFFRKIGNDAGGEKAYMDWSGAEVAPFLTESFASCSILLNNNPRVQPRDPLYFRKVTSIQTHTNIPSKNMYAYAFGIQSESGAPSGSLNFSRIDHSQMVFKFTAALPEDYDLHVYAKTHNWVTIDRGLGKKHFA